MLTVGASTIFRTLTPHPVTDVEATKGIHMMVWNGFIRIVPEYSIRK